MHERCDLCGAPASAAPLLRRSHGLLCLACLSSHPEPRQPPPTPPGAPGASAAPRRAHLFLNWVLWGRRG